MVLMAIFAPLIAPENIYDPNGVDVFDAPDQAPTFSSGLRYLFGSDLNNHSISAQIIYGARFSLLIGFSSSISPPLIGTIVGAVSGYFGGWIDTLPHAHRRRLPHPPLPPAPLRRRRHLRRRPHLRPAGHRHLHLLRLGLHRPPGPRPLPLPAHHGVRRGRARRRRLQRPDHPAPPAPQHPAPDPGRHHPGHRRHTSPARRPSTSWASACSIPTPAGARSSPSPSRSSSSTGG